MSIIDFIEKLRDKPEMARRRILVGATFAITAIIFFFWLSVKLYDAGGSSAPISAAAVENRGPISDTINAVENFIGSASRSIDSLKKMVSDSIASTTASTTAETR
jgi:hypothetical protein